MAEKYNVQNIPLEQVLNYIKSGEIAIPEIQRPFVWKTTQVRDLIDSLYSGYPTGYLIITQNPNLKLKDGHVVEGKKIMIDGQQRVTALMTAIVGRDIITEDFDKKRYKISFNPLADDENEEERFKVQTPATLNDKRWIADIADVFAPNFDTFGFVTDYCNTNEGVVAKDLNNTLMKLIDIKNRQIGIITLNKDLTIDEVTEIFIRINSQGAKLNQADFAMSRIASDSAFGGNMLRKAIDYFSHLALQPNWYSEMSKDKEFMNSIFADKLKWLKDDNEEILDPDHNDILRIAFMYKFGRGKMKDLVSLLSGRDFETRDYKETIAEATFRDLTAGVLDFMNEHNFSSFVLAIKSIGFRASKLITSKLTLDFAYTLHLLLKAEKKIDNNQITRYVQKWFVLTILKGRYIGSPETVMDQDLKRIKEKGFQDFLKEVEEADLSDTYWNVGLIQDLDKASIHSPHFNVFLASQIRSNDSALFTKGFIISDLISDGDVHHIFPRQYLKKNGITERSKYNHIANYTYLETSVNKAISDKAPNVYFSEAFNQCETGKAIYGNITNREDLLENLCQNCIPESVVSMDYTQYEEFLLERRKLMAQKIKEYYQSL